jgi:hypothetical protein
MDDSHAKIELWVTKMLIAVNVTDLKSSSGTFHGNEKIRKSMKLFPGDLIKLGGTILRVNQLDTAKVATATVEMPAVKKRAGHRLASDPEVFEIARAPADEEVYMEDASHEEPTSKRQGLKLQVIVGPNLGDTFEIEHGACDTVNVGSKPSGKKNKIALTKDSSLKANHMQLKLYSYARRHYGLIITDKNTGAVKINGDTISQTGRASVNDCISLGNTVLKVLGPL